MTPIERAARAAALWYICDREARTPDDEYAISYAEASWSHHVDQIRAVLTAIREPGEEMEREGWKKYGNGPCVVPIYQAMIDAALAERP